MNGTIIGIMGWIVHLVYIVLMIYFLVSKNEKQKLAGKIMLGLFIAPCILALLFFVTCVGILGIGGIIH